MHNSGAIKSKSLHTDEGLFFICLLAFSWLQAEAAELWYPQKQIRGS